MFTYFLIGAAALLVIAAVVGQIRGRKTPGRVISQDAPSNSDANNRATFQHKLNETSGGFGGII